MNPVIQRLALRALPGTDGVRPRIASRFDWSAPAPLPPTGDKPFAEVAPVDRAATIAPTALASSAPSENMIAHADRDDAPPADIPRRSPRKSVATDQATPITSIGEPDIASFSDAATVQDARLTGSPDSVRHWPRPAQESDTAISPARATFTTLLLPDLAAPPEPVFALSVPPAAKADLAPLVQHSEPALPDIHVTIGRIDITAEREQRAAPRPAPPPRPKLMSLEDYLAKGRSRR